MKKLLILLLLLSFPAYAQRVSDLPAASLPLTGNELMSLDQNGVTKRVPTSVLLNGSFVVGIPNGGTGLTSVGTSGTCLGSNGVGLTYVPCSGGGGGGGVGSGLTSQSIVTSLNSITATCNEFVGFNNSSGIAKSVTIPAAVGSLCYIVVSDLFGDAYAHHITVTPVSGNISGNSQVYSNLSSISLLDTSFGWVSY